MNPTEDLLSSPAGKYIPNDNLKEIFMFYIGNPFFTLRYRLVCKQWKNALESDIVWSYFVSQFLSVPKKPPKIPLWKYFLKKARTSRYVVTVEDDIDAEGYKHLFSRHGGVDGDAILNDIKRIFQSETRTIGLTDLKYCLLDLACFCCASQLDRFFRNKFQPENEDIIVNSLNYIYRKVKLKYQWNLYAIDSPNCSIKLSLFPTESIAQEFRDFKAETTEYILDRRREVHCLLIGV